MDIFNKKKVKKLEEMINDIRNHRDYYEKLYISQVEHTNSLVKDNNYLKEENTKLCDWVFNILKEFGTSNVREPHIRIPIIEQDSVYTMLNEGTIKEQRIEIPSITIIKKEML